MIYSIMIKIFETININQIIICILIIKIISYYYLHIAENPGQLYYIIQLVRPSPDFLKSMYKFGYGVGKF